MTLRVGLTGGIGCGKSTVTEILEKKGVPVIDTDVIARQLVEPGETALAEISDTLGKEFITANGRLDRARLRDAIFEDEATRKRLEAILHPRVAGIVAEEVNKQNAPYCIIVIPLLFEADQEFLVDRVLVVDAQQELQISRVVERDHTDVENVRKIIANQLDRNSRLARADDVIVNDGDKSALEAQVNRLHDRYLEMNR